MEMFIQVHAVWEMQEGDTQEQGVSFSQELTLELRGELVDIIVTLKMTYKQLSTDQHRITCFVDGSFMVNGQHAVWKVTTLTEQGENKPAQLAALYAVF